MINLFQRYVEQIKSISQQGYVVSFAKKLNSHKFKWLIKDEISEIGRSQVVKKIHAPIMKTSNFICFIAMFFYFLVFNVFTARVTFSKDLSKKLEGN